MPSARAQEVAEVLFELKRASKIAAYTVVARRAGFSPGSKGRTMMTTLAAVRRDWPHLQWWRALPDGFHVERLSEQTEALREAGFEIEDVDGKEDLVTIAGIEEHLMAWDESGEAIVDEPEAEEDAAKDESEKEGGSKAAADEKKKKKKKKTKKKTDAD